MHNPKAIMPTKRLLTYSLLACSLLFNAWTWFSSPHPPQLDKIVLRYPVTDQDVVYGVSTNGGGATVGFSYRYYLGKVGSSDEKILSSLVDKSPFLITKDPHVNFQSRGTELDAQVTGRIDRFHSQALIRHGSDDYSVVNINLTSSSGETGSN
jgi:hypothetical protein